MPDSNKLAQQISALFAEKLHLQVPSLDTDLIDTGLVDSLTFVEFLAQLEQEFGVQVSLQDLELDRFRTVTRIAASSAFKCRCKISSSIASGRSRASPPSSRASLGTAPSSAFKSDRRRPPAQLTARRFESCVGSSTSWLPH